MKKFYKVLGHNMDAMYGNGMIYEMNKWYGNIHMRDVSVTKYRYHFFDNIRDCLLFGLSSEDKDYRIFEVEYGGFVDKCKLSDICLDGICYATNRIRLIRELSEDEINEYIREHICHFASDKNVCIHNHLIDLKYIEDVDDKTYRLLVPRRYDK